MTISTGGLAEPEGRATALRTWPLGRTARRGKATASILSAILSIILGISALASCAPAPSLKAPTATAQASATVPPSVTATPRLVYQADWSHGLAGWMATPGWHVSGGVLQSDTGSDRKITSPFQPTTPDYAVEFRLQVIRVSQSAATQYELSADPAAGVDGYIALFDNITLSHDRLSFFQHPHESIYIDPMMDQQDMGVHTVQVHDFEPGTLLRTYRVEVRGPVATLLIDGHVASLARSIKAPHLSAGLLHFYCTGVELRLSDFRVYSL